MNRILLRSLVVGVAFVALFLGCSEQSREPLAPQQVQSTSMAPLYNQGVGAKYVPDSYIVVFKDAVTDVDGDVTEIGVRLAVTPNFTYKHALKGFAGKLTAAQLDNLRRDPRVAYVEQDQIAHIVATQLNPTWGLDRIDQRNLPLDASYTYNQTGAGVTVYGIDTGILQSHSDFGGRAVFGYDAVVSGGTANDDNGHGTHTAGTIGGATYGVAKGAKLVAVKVLNSAGSGTYSQVIAGINWVTSDHTAHPGPAVANMSLGGPVDAALDQAVRNSIASGVVYCVAAGNSAVDASTQSPADVAEAITVGATDNTDAFAYFSNYGSVVDLSAPGVNVTSDWNTSNTATNTISGTSMATPHVAGAAALYLQANPTATPAAVQSAIVANATANVISSLPAGTANRLLYSVVSGGGTNQPPVAVVNGPYTGVTGTPVAFSSSGSTDPDGTIVGYSWTFGDGGTSALANPSYTYATAGTYTVTLTVTDNLGATGSASTTATITSSGGTPPAAPTLVSPSNGATGVSRNPTLKWNASAGATSYRVQVATSSAFTTLVADRSGLTTTSTTITGLGSRTYYYWRVNASNAAGTSPWSSVRYFRTTR